MPDSRVTGANSRVVCGPFPRSLWTHPYSPEDDFDRLCAEIWRRAERTKKGIWSYSLDYSSLFNNDQTAETAKGLERVVKQNELDEIALMIRREHQVILREHGTIASAGTTASDSCSHGDELPAYAEGKEEEEEEERERGEMISQEEKQCRSIEKFLKGLLIHQQEEKEAPPLSEEEFPPLPCAASPWASPSGDTKQGRGAAGAQSGAGMASVRRADGPSDMARHWGPQDPAPPRPVGRAPGPASSKDMPQEDLMWFTSEQRPQTSMPVPPVQPLVPLKPTQPTHPNQASQANQPNQPHVQTPPWPRTPPIPHNNQFASEQRPQTSMPVPPVKPIVHLKPTQTSQPTDPNQANQPNQPHVQRPPWPKTPPIPHMNQSPPLQPIRCPLRPPPQPVRHQHPHDLLHHAGFPSMPTGHPLFPQHPPPPRPQVRPQHVPSHPTQQRPCPIQQIPQHMFPQQQLPPQFPPLRPPHLQVPPHLQEPAQPPPPGVDLSPQHAHQRHLMDIHNAYMNMTAPLHGAPSPMRAPPGFSHPQVVNVPTPAQLAALMMPYGILHPGCQGVPLTPPSVPQRPSEHLSMSGDGPPWPYLPLHSLSRLHS